MNRVLRKRLLRDLKHNFLRNLALVLMIVMGMYVVVSIVGAADTIIVGSIEKAEENHVEDGQFGVFLPLADAQEKELTDTGIALEKMFSMDLEAEDASVVRLMKNREKINLIDLDEGHLAKDSGEVVLEKRYCEEHGLKTGDSITIADLQFEITGIGSTPDYDLPIQTFSDMAVESTRFGTGFVTEEQYEEMKENKVSKAEDYCYAYRLNDSGMTDDEVKQIVKKFDIEYDKVKAVSFQEMIADTIGKNIASFVKKADNPRIFAAMGDMQINKEAGLFAGVIVMILFTYVISVFVIHQIQEESSVIGTLYALGAKKKDLLIHYITLPTVLTLIGGVIGSLLGFSKFGIPTQTANSYQYFSIPKLDVCYSVYLIIYSMVMPPVVSVIVNYLVINKRLSQTALSLIRKEHRLNNQRFFNRKFAGCEKGMAISMKEVFFRLGRMKFIRRFQLRQMIRERRTGFTVVCGMMISLLVLMLGLNCYVLCENVQKDTMNSTRFEYMYFLKYPIKEVPEGGEVCYAESLSKTALGYTLNVSVIGIDEDNKYYETEPVKGKSSIVISKSVQQKYGLHIEDQLTLTDNAEDTDYVFTVKGICDYAGGLTVFMDIDSMRELFGQEEDYYNMLLSDKELIIDEGRIYSMTTREDAEHSASIFTSLMMPLVILMTVAAVIIFCMVLYLMMGVMIDRSSFGISLVQVFGFRTGEIKKIYLNGNTWIVAVGAVIGIPFAKVIMDALYPWMIANAAVGMNLEFPWYLYALIFVGVMVVYFVVNTLLVRKLKRITPAEVLKNRE
ncbi:MAG: ABC transporter permease [Lachnospiraceae bacterium]|nr:ABC transporter permease [Lachnospiraceae bacterium]